MKKIGNVLVVEPHGFGICEDCGDMEELRPCGPGRSNVCVSCAMKTPEILQSLMMENVNRMMKQTTVAVGPQGQVLSTRQANDDHQDLISRRN